MSLGLQGRGPELQLQPGALRGHGWCDLSPGYEGSGEATAGGSGRAQHQDLLLFSLETNPLFPQLLTEGSGQAWGTSCYRA